jgi:hypothetical protein
LVRFEAFAKLRDLSLGGVFVESQFRFNGAPDLTIELKLPDGAMPIEGSVVRQPDGGLGIAFSTLPQKERARLLKHFVPEAHRSFYEDVVVGALPKDLGLDRVSLLLHLWDDWRSERGDLADG